MIDIKIKSIPHWTQRYGTIGDWIEQEDGSVYIRVSDLGDWRMEFGIAFHELVESFLCRRAGISSGQVDEYDFASDAEDPGNEPDAPYHREHVLSNGMEVILLTLLGVDLNEYEEKCRKLGSTASPNKATEPGSPSGS